MGLAATETSLSTETKLKKPSKYAVYILNDDYTPWNFVLLTLMAIFHKTEQEAQILTADVHKKGEGICGIYSKEVAETKVHAASELAKEHKQPLRTVMRKI